MSASQNINPMRGDTTLVINDQQYRLRLTLGAIAEFESLRKKSVFELISDFEAQKVTSQDLIAILVAGLRAQGWKGSQGDLETAEIEGGFPAALNAAVGALVGAFQPDFAGAGA